MRRETREPYLLRILPYGLLAYAVLLVLTSAVHGGLTPIYAGRMMTPVVMGCGIAWLMARGSGNTWRWWAYPLATLTVALGLGIVLSVPDITAAVRGDRLTGVSPERFAPGESPGTEAPTATLKAPQSSAGWRELHKPAATREVRRVVEGTKKSVGSTDVEGGYYVHASNPANPVLFWVINTPISGLPEANLRDLMAGASVPHPRTFDASRLGGTLMCGNGTQADLRWTVCAWSAGATTAVLRWERPVALGRAAELTRDLLKLASA